MGQGDGEGPDRVAMGFPAMVRDQGERAALAGAPPSTCPYRAEDSRARLLWLEAYLAVLEAPDCPPESRAYRTLIDIMRLAVTQALAGRDSDNVVRMPTLRKA